MFTAVAGGVTGGVTAIEIAAGMKNDKQWK